MADAGSIFFESMSEAGRSIGSAIGQLQDRRRKHQQTAEMVEIFAKTPRNPDAPPGSPESKPLLDLKTYQFLQGELKTKGAAADAAIQAYMAMGQKLAYEGAKAQIKTEQLGTGPEFVHTDQGTFFRGSKGWQRVPGGPTAGQTGVQERFQQKELDKGINKIETELSGADISDPEFLLKPHYKTGYMKGDKFHASGDQKTHVRVKTDEGEIHLPTAKFNHLKKKAKEWKELKRQKTMPHADQTGSNIPILSPEEVHRLAADPNNAGMYFRRMDNGKVMKIPGGNAEPATATAEDNGSDDGSDQ